jgi:allophanate hydrolase subunit 1
MSRAVPVGEVRPFGDRALLIGTADPPAGRDLAALLGRARAMSDVEVVCGHSTVGVIMRDPDASLGPVRAAAHDAVAVAASPEAPHAGADTGRLVTIPCAFEGPDLAEVAALAGFSTDEVVRC